MDVTGPPNAAAACRSHSRRLPFPKMRTLVVRVDTREKLTYLCTFDDTVFLRSRFIVNARKNVLVFKKGSIPLLSNCLGMLPWS